MREYLCEWVMGVWVCKCFYVCVFEGNWLPVEIVESPWAIPCPSVASAAARSGNRSPPPEPKKKIGIKFIARREGRTLIETGTKVH